MKLLFKRIITGICVVSITFSCIVPAVADTEVSSEIVSFWDKFHKWAFDNSQAYGGVPAILAKLVIPGLSADICGSSDDGLHHGALTGDSAVIKGQQTYKAKCKYCNSVFFVSDAQISTAYSNYVSTLPAQGYDSAGTLLWQPNWSDISNWASFKGISAGDVFSIDTTGTLVYGSAYDPDFYSPVSINGSVMSISVAYGKNGGNGLRVGNADNSLYFSAPVSGTYFIIWDTPVIEYSWFTIDGSSLQGTSTCGQWYSWASKTKGTTVSKGSNVSAVFANRSGSSGGYMGYTNFSCTYRRNIYYRTPVFRVYPSVSSITNNYTLNTRVNNFNGDYYDSVTNNYYNNTTIVNETTNNYYDMTTNNNYTMSNWSYDYAFRTYFITLEDGTTVTVQFGDDCMTITKNDVTNSYQYVIKNNSTPDTPTGCKHDWQETIDTAPTCLEGGHASYTCSLCGETYEQILAAKGHDWKVIEHVNMVYNSDGTVATQGHTLYQCSVCGEQWYTDSGAPPPDVSGSSNILAWLQSFQAWLDEKLDLTPVLERLDAILAELQSTSGSATCEHTYEQHMEQDADCTLPGLQVSTCSQCGDSYSEIIDPLGHDWVISSHVDAVTDPDTGEETASAYDVYTCSRCGKTYEDHTGDGAPDEDYSSSSISQLVVKVFSKLGTFAGKLIGFIVRLFDKAISSVDEVISKFNEYTEQISGFGGDYPAWLTGFWTVLPSELQVALTFAVVCMVLGIVGKKLFFS